MKLIFLSGAVFLMALLLFGLGCDRKVTFEPSDDQASLGSCFTCHGEDGLLLAAKGEWQNSIHASGNNVDYTNRGGRNCPQCHDHQGFVDYVSTGVISPPYNQVSAIHCFTCHSPHERGNLTLRVESSYTLANNDIFNHGSANLCVNCHHSTFNANSITDSVTLSNRWGPHHGPQGDLLVGTGGYEYEDYVYETSPHAFAVDDACIGCHMGNPEIHNGYQTGGHSFNMVYINEKENDTITLVSLCADSACHPGAVTYDINGAQTEIEGLLEDLRVLLYAGGYIDDENLPTSVKVNKEIAGAVLNFLLIYEDRSRGIHNYKYMKGLLESAIEYMEGISPVSNGRNGSFSMFRPRAAH
ncbi:MAG: hypothetical protein PHU88_11000 [candidate division Zixibacteria bacterium]|nr:hypothetical protein [candidate division Zixibacteria bacterium]